MTLKEIFFGGITLYLCVNKNDICDLCNGNQEGYKIGEMCRRCSGLGIKLPFIKQDIEEHCESCWLKGEVFHPEDRCDKCKRSIAVPDHTWLIVHAKRGSRNCQQIHHFQNSVTRPGNFTIELRDMYIDEFRRKGDDLIITMQLEWAEAVGGFTKIIKTIDGRQLSISSPEGHEIRDNDLKFIAGEGMPIFENPNLRGKLVIHFAVKIPENMFSEDYVYDYWTGEFMPPRDNDPANVLKVHKLNLVNLNLKIIVSFSTLTLFFLNRIPKENLSKIMKDSCEMAFILKIGLTTTNTDGINLTTM